MAKKKFYAIRKGRQPGVYSTWPEAERQVKGYGGAIFKGFATREEAEKWLTGDETASSSGKPVRRQRKQPVVQQPKESEIFIYTDGGAINNPGPGGYGVVILDGNEKRELSGGFRRTTNNRMELTAAIVALQEVLPTDKKIVLFSDSSYLVNGVMKKWVNSWQKNGWVKADKSPVLNVDLWKKILHLCKGRGIVFKWVKGHAGNPCNERCDTLAVQAARGEHFGIDTVYEEISNENNHFIKT